MSANPEALIAAYKAFGLGGGEDFSEVRARFRALVKQVHPDTVEETPQTTTEVADQSDPLQLRRLLRTRDHCAA